MKPLNEQECAKIINHRIESMSKAMKLVEEQKPLMRHEVIQLRDDAISIHAAAQGLLNNYDKRSK